MSGRVYQGILVWICQIRLSLSEVVEVEKELKGHVRAENQKARIPDNRESKHQTELLTIENPKFRNHWSCACSPPEHHLEIP
jgi:hypothetical protein